MQNKNAYLFAIYKKNQIFYRSLHFNIVNFSCVNYLLCSIARPVLKLNINHLAFMKTIDHKQVVYTTWLYLVLQIPIYI